MRRCELPRCRPFCSPTALQSYVDLPHGVLPILSFSATFPFVPFQVRSMLRSRGHPITLFGEREMERRDRLREILAKEEATVRLYGGRLGQASLAALCLLRALKKKGGMG